MFNLFRKNQVNSGEECNHLFLKYPPFIGKFRVCIKCGAMHAPGGIKSGIHSIKISGSGNYIEASTTTAPANPASGKIRLYSTGNTNLSMKDSAGAITVITDPFDADEILMDF